jgi:membrane peptidoglycan carboxypeptidase
VDGWWVTSLPTIAIGQGVSATLLQVAGVFQVVASGGEWREPTLVRGTVGPDGSLSRAGASRSAAGCLRGDRRGARRHAHRRRRGRDRRPGRRAGLPVAGKTGTAQKPSKTSRGYEPGAYIATFAGFAPAEDPAIVVAVMIDEPTPIWGASPRRRSSARSWSFALSHQRVVPSDPRRRSGPPAGGWARGRRRTPPAVARPGEWVHGIHGRAPRILGGRPSPSPPTEPRVTDHTPTAIALADLLAACPATPRLVGDGAVALRDVTHDSREAGPGVLFACRPGQRTDGHDFAPAAGGGRQPRAARRAASCP